jgi:hypothetical protein
MIRPLSPETSEEAIVRAMPFSREKECGSGPPRQGTVVNRQNSQSCTSLLHTFAYCETSSQVTTYEYLVLSKEKTPSPVFFLEFFIGFSRF